jgi:hypothetical protein
LVSIAIWPASKRLSLSFNACSYLTPSSFLLGLNNECQILKARLALNQAALTAKNARIGGQFRLTTYLTFSIFK